MLPAIALRNLSRNRRRTLLSLSVVSVGCAALLLTVGFIRYSFSGLADAIIHGGLAHFEIAPTAPDTPVDGDRSSQAPAFQDWRAVRDRLERRPGIRAAMGTIQLVGVLANGDRSAAFLAVSVEPERQRRMGLETKIRLGAGLPDTNPQPGEDQVLLGTGLARALGASPGDVIVAMVGSSATSLNAVDLTVAGVFTTGLQDLDARVAGVHLATAQRLLATENVSSLLVGLDDDADPGAAAAAIREEAAASPGALTVRDWQSRAPFYGQVRGLYLGIFAFLGTIIGLLVTLSASNTLQMSVMERVREFGMLVAIGTDRRQLAGLIMLEALWLAVIGALTGSLVALAASAGINLLGIEMPPPPGAVDPILLSVRLEPRDFAGAAVFMALLLVAATVPPVVKIVRLRIAEALGHV